MKYVMFTERNDWEGETWNFFIPVDGNETAIEQVRKLIKGQEGTYRLSTKTWTEREVQKLIHHNRTGYMPEYNLAVGFLDLPKSIDWYEEDPFYKGGLIRYPERTR